MTVTAPTSVSAWKQAADAVTVEVPSGNVCRARRSGMQAFVKAGVVPNSLLGIVIQAMKSGKLPDLSKVDKDPAKVMDAVRLTDAVCVEIMVEPRVLPIPPQEDTTSEFYDPDFERDEDSLYVDQVDINDKIFLFQWACGGTSDLEQFRQPANKPLVAARPSKAVRKPAKRTAGANSRNG